MFMKIIIPCYNVGDTIGRMLDSILAQTFTDYHIVCVEDCSTDNTWDVLQSYKEKNPDKMTLIKNPHNMGPGETRNRGYFMTADSLPSEFIWMVDGDDYLADNDVLLRISSHCASQGLSKQAKMVYVGISKGGKFVQSGTNYPIGPYGAVVRQGYFVSYRRENLQGCEDVYQHLVQIDSVEPDEISYIDSICYVMEKMGFHRVRSKVGTSFKFMSKLISSLKFKQRHTLVALKFVDDIWRKYHHRPLVVGARPSTIS